MSRGRALGPEFATRRWAVTQFGGCTAVRSIYPGRVDEVERLLRQLALNNEPSVRDVLVTGNDRVTTARLDEKVGLLVRLGALLTLGAATSSLRVTVDQAIQAGASEPEIVDVLVTVGPAVGLARVVAAAPRLARALGYDIEANE